MSDQDVDAFLEHYGVKGMQWGVRNEKRGSRDDRRAQRSSNKAAKAKAKAARSPRQKAADRQLTIAKVKIGAGVAIISIAKLDAHMRNNPMAYQKAAASAGRMAGKSYRAAANVAYGAKIIFEKGKPFYYPPGTGPAPGTYANAAYIMKELTT